MLTHIGINIHPLICILIYTHIYRYEYTPTYMYVLLDNHIYLGIIYGVY